MLHLLAWGTPGLPEMIIIAAIGLLIFGKRLPEVGRSLGKGIVEFKKGLKGVEEDETEQVDSRRGFEVQQVQPQLPPPNVQPTPYQPAQYTQAAPAYSQGAYAPPPQGPAIGQPVAQNPGGFKFDPYTGKPIDPLTAEAQPAEHQTQA